MFNSPWMGEYYFITFIITWPRSISLGRVGKFDCERWNKKKYSDKYTFSVTCSIITHLQFRYKYYALCSTISLVFPQMTAATQHSQKLKYFPQGLPQIAKKKKKISSCSFLKLLSLSWDSWAFHKWKCNRCSYGQKKTYDGNICICYLAIFSWALHEWMHCVSLIFFNKSCDSFSYGSVLVLVSRYGSLPLCAHFSYF